MESALRRLWSRPATRLVLVFVGIPVLAFGVPAAAGLPWVTGDNLIQNFPLRVLAGVDLRAGHLPLWNPYIWSGSPLLAGFNSGAAYPLTWLFAVLPHVLAWLTGQVAVEVVAAFGVFTLLRFQGRSFLAATVGAAAFAYGGVVSMQVVHIDLVEAAGWLVWAFVALDRIGHRPAGRSVLPWVALLGASLGLMVLTGAAEPILDGGVALVLFALWLLWTCRGRRLELIVSVVSGAALAALIGAAQLLPGNALQGQSQRAAHTYWYFASGSMNKSLTVLLVDPLLLGGAHSVPLSYVGTYNLPEISGYVGILPVMAAVGLLAKRHRTDPEARRWWIWYAIAVVGVVLVWGAFTPLGHLEHLVPLYNRQRLLARNWLEVDLALVVLFAAWVDHMLLAARPVAERAGRGVRRWRSDVVLPLLPVAAVVVLQVILAAGGAWFPHVMHVPQPVSYGVLWPQDLLLTVPSVIAVAAGWLVVGGARLGRLVPRLLVAVVAADLLFFNAMAQTDPQVGTALAGSTDSRALASVLSSAPRGPGGVSPRFALYDPDRYYSAQANDIGQPDENVLQSLRSVQGYGALSGARYENATATHLQGNLALSALSDGTFAGLDLGALVVPPQYFMTLVVPPPSVAATLPGTVGPTPAATPLPPVPPDRSGPASPLSAPPTPVAIYSRFVSPARSTALSPGAPHTWFFGTVLAVHAVAMSVPTASPSRSGSRVRVGVLSAAGTGVRWLEGAEGVAVSRKVVVEVPGSPDAAGIVIEQVAPARAALDVEAPLVATAGQGTYRLEGGLSRIVTSPTWSFAGTVDDFGVFEEVPSGAASVQPASAGTARVVSTPTWGDDRIAVDLGRPALLVRNEAYDRGWQATVSEPGTGGRTKELTVARHGLVQSVSLPAGRYQVTFRYRPGRVKAGLIASAVGVVLAAGVAVIGLRRARRPRRTVAAARPATARSARVPDGVAPGPGPSVPEERWAAPPPRAP